MERQSALNAAAPTSSAWVVTSQQREPPVFAGLRGDDVEDWLEHYDRVSQFNRWDDAYKLKSVGFYLSDVADTWYRNHRETLTDWATFTEKLRQIFGTPSTRSDIAKRKLDARWQRSDETYAAYIEDVLALCRRVSPDMSEADKVRHVLKGIAEFAFNSLVLQNPASVDDIRNACQRLDQLQAIRLRPSTEPARLPPESELRTLIRNIIREELQQQGSSCVHGDRCSQPATDLRGIIKEELASMTGHSNSTSPLAVTVQSYADAASRPPVLAVEASSHPPMLGQLAAMSSPPPAQRTYATWRPSLDVRPNERPVCYYCGIRGHISRYCRRRQQDERRGYAPYERDVRYNCGARRPEYPPRQRSPSPQDSIDRTRSYRDPRRRSPSPSRRFVSPIRSVSRDQNSQSEN